MKALLLAAGYGSRLGDLTKKQPKPTIEINGRSIIDHIISKLHIHGITEIIVNLHYLQSMMINHLQDNVLYFYEPRLLGHKGTIMAHKSGMITSFMDENRAAGTWIYPPLYFKDQNLPINPYRDPIIKWFDLGTKERLEEAKKYFNQNE